MDEKNLEEIKEKEKKLEEDSSKMKESYSEKIILKTAKNINDAVYELSKRSIINMLNYDIQNKITKDCLDELDKMNEVKFWAFKILN